MGDPRVGFQLTRQACLLVALSQQSVPGLQGDRHPECLSPACPRLASGTGAGGQAELVFRCVYVIRAGSWPATPSPAQLREKVP